MMADRLLNAMHMEFKAEPRWVTRSGIVKVENTCAIPHHTPLACVQRATSAYLMNTFQFVF